MSLGLQNKEHSYYIKNSRCSVEKFGDKSEITNVVEIGEKECKCVTVDNDSGCYLINEYVPTHNSYSVAAILAKLFLLGENDLNKSKVKANMFSYLKEYLNKDGTLDKFVNAINHCGDHTEFPSLRLKDSMSEMQWKSGFMDSENRPRGSQNEVLGLAIKDDPGKARGKRPHPYSENVITYSGIKKWGDIKIGDTLIGGDGKPTNVIQIHEVGEQDIYKIELSDGREVRSTLDHLWQVDIHNEKVDKTTEELIDLIKSDYVYIRSCSPIEPLCEKDVDVVEFIDSGGNILELSIYQRLQYFKIKYDDLAYANYLWINDLDKKEVEIVSRVARSLGWDCYSGSHSVRINKCPSKSRIINIELVGREQAKCVTVDNDSHLYLIGDFVITHNSSFQAVEEFGFLDLIDEERSIAFWKTLSYFRRAIDDECEKYSKHLGVAVPHTNTVVKPAGCMSPTTQVKTTEGIKTLQQIFEDSGYNIDQYATESGVWLEVTKPVSVYDCNNEVQNVTRLYINGRCPTVTLSFEDSCLVS